MSKLMDDAEKRHQVVRELVERKYPACRVVEIEETTYTRVVFIHTGADLGLVSAGITYHVQARPRLPGDPALTCVVVLAKEGELHIKETTLPQGG